ncbi:unnamed protein product [Tilletia controversa]|uniref:Mitochondrial import inner membrane translocase subunit n=3 Tax=Tilletia TaxID=13289 RepID=A0A8X7MWD1_9BASI|nr:hypothetical protein CF336_g2097 [Tilletia laevis]KAE8202797.1 hypothetical protein CF328_g2012 [Tilletia controversa]KAE8256619.1 hypothetical protein A4X03_0g5225 [Tilletia caries]KAE8207117.1 hypothetical protein CF335_g1385 [Tilletia laevis]KAE8252021.1 hypothetical protein A4X06_0g2443 [Tilletia controversa]
MFGLGGSGGGPQSSHDMASMQVEAATAELDMITDVFNRLVSSCHSKCVGKTYHEADLNKGESVCIDRCVAKFFTVNAKVGERMQAVGGQAAAGGGAAGGGGSFFG